MSSSTAFRFLPQSLSYQLEQQYTQKLQQSGSQHTLHQQRLDEMDMTVQKTISRSKRLEEERHNFHSRLIEADKEVGVLKVELFCFTIAPFLFLNNVLFSRIDFVRQMPKHKT